MADFSKKALKLILDAEGLDQPSKWPGGNSGISLGRGYDLGFVTAAQLKADWGAFLTEAQIKLLKTAIGLTGIPAKNIALKFADIKIKVTDADKVFAKSTLPLHRANTERIYPGVTDLPADAYGALVSLVFNRGTSLTGDRRREMKAIKPAVKNKDLREIAKQIRLMKRLWIGQGLDGLLIRRENEALLVESAI